MYIYNDPVQLALMTGRDTVTDYYDPANDTNQVVGYDTISPSASDYTAYTHHTHSLCANDCELHKEVQATLL